jgi:hypothetical protein
MTRTTCWIGAVCTLLVGRAAIAQQTPPAHPPPSRVSLGLIGGSMLGDAAGTSARGPNTSGQASMIGGVIGYERRVLDRLSLQATSSSLSLLDGAAAQAGYRLNRLQFGVAPYLKLLTIPLALRQPSETYVHLATPIGFGFDVRTVPARRAFTESIDGRLGWYVGAALGATLIKGSMGARVELGYRRSTAGETTTLVPSDGSPTITERRDYVDHQLLLTLAAMFAF